jgi:DNA polymerase III alpha subunit
MAMVAAGFSPTEADQLRRSMATFKFTGGVHKFQDKLIKGMLRPANLPNVPSASSKASAATAFRNPTSEGVENLLG